MREGKKYLTFAIIAKVFGKLNGSPNAKTGRKEYKHLNSNLCLIIFDFKITYDLNFVYCKLGFVEYFRMFTIFYPSGSEPYNNSSCNFQIYLMYGIQTSIKLHNLGNLGVICIAVVSYMDLVANQVKQTVTFQS